MSARVHTNAKRRRADAVARLMQVRERAVASPDPTWATARTGRVLPGEIRSPYKGHATVFRCIRVIVGALIRPPLIAKKGSGEERAPSDWRVRALNDPTGAPMTGTPLNEGPWADLLKTPNPHMTRRQFVEAHGTYLLTTGECGWLLLKNAAPCGIAEVPDTVWPVHRGMLEPIMDDATASILEGWRITHGKGVMEVPWWALIHHRYAFDPEAPLRGLGPIGAARSAMSADMKAEAWSESFFDNAAEPGGILTTDGVLTPRQREDMEASWKMKHGGTKRGGVAVLEGGLTYQQVGISQRDMDFLGQRQWNDTQIARVFGVPKFFLMEGTDISYASTRQNKRALWELAVLPIIDTTEDVCEARLTGVRDASVWWEFDITRIEALKEDLAANLEVGERMTRMGYPLNQVNERLDLGMARQPWGDEGFLPMGVAPASAIAQGFTGTDPEAVEPVEEEPDEDTLPQGDKPPETTAPVPDRIARVHGRASAEEARAERSTRWRAIERGVMRPGSGKMQRRIRGYLNGRRGEVLRFLGGLDSNALRSMRDMARDMDPDAGGLIDRYLAEQQERWGGLIARQTTPIFRNIVAAAAKGVASELGGLAFFSMGDPRVAAFMQRKVVLVQSVPNTIIKGLRATLVEGLRNAEDANQLQDRARLLFQGAQSRSLSIARTESAQATNGSRFIVMQAERVEQHEWLTSDDEAVRDETATKRLRPKANHRRLDGMEASLGQTFVPGIHLHHPGDVQAPAHWVVNCRCSAGAVRRRGN